MGRNHKKLLNSLEKLRKSAGLTQQQLSNSAELTIYNRWGQIQYFSVGYNLKWDGMNSVGSLAPAGTYFYTLNIKDKTFSGKIQLFR